MLDEISVVSTACVPRRKGRRCQVGLFRRWQIAEQREGIPALPVVLDTIIDVDMSVAERGELRLFARLS